MVEIIGQIAQSAQSFVQASVSRQNTLDTICTTRQNLLTKLQADRALQESLESRREAFRESLFERQVSVQEHLQTQQQEFQLKLHQFQAIEQYFLQQDRQSHDERMAALNARYQRELQAFRQEHENQQLEKRLKFEEFLFEKKKQLEWEFRAYDRETQYLLSVLSLQHAQQNADYHRLHEAHPLTIPFSVSLEFYATRPAHLPVPPLVILAPPVLEHDTRSLKEHRLSPLETPLTKAIRATLSRYYPLHSETCPVKFLGNAYKTKSIRGEAAVDLLFATHRTVPTVLIETQINGEQLDVYGAWWEPGDIAPNYQHFLAVNWEKEGDIAPLSETLAFGQSLLISLIVDSYYVRHYQMTPQLPRLLPELLNPISDVQQKEQVVEMVVTQYRQLYASLAPQLASWIPDLAVDFANSLIEAKYPIFAREQLEYALRTWLKLKGKESKNEATFQEVLASIKVEAVFTTTYMSFIESVNECLAKLGEQQITVEHGNGTRNMEREQVLERELAELKRKHQEEEENRALGKYRELRDLLAAGKWYDADELTKALMLKEVERTKQERLNLASLQQFPAHLAQTIDRLWVKYSNGRFGFSVQKRIFEECRQQVGAFLFHLAWTRLQQYHPQDVDDVGHLYGIPTSTVWKLTVLHPQNRYSTETLYPVTFNIKPFLRYSLSAPEGHLPAAILISPMLYETDQEQREYQECNAKNRHGNENIAFFKAYLEELWAKLDAPTT